MSTILLFKIFVTVQVHQPVDIVLFEFFLNVFKMGMLRRGFRTIIKNVLFPSLTDVRSHVGWKGERNIVYKGVETSPYKIVRLMMIRNGSKRIISTNGGLEPLQSQFLFKILMILS